MEKQEDTTLNLLLQEGVAGRVFPGAVSGVAFRSENAWKWQFGAAGKTRNEGLAQAVNFETFFDLASLTKPLCTVLSCAFLVGQNKMALTDYVTDLPGFRDYPGHWRRIRVMDLLNHSSGLIAYREFFRNFPPEQRAENREKLFQLIQNEPPENAPGEVSVYSDLGYLVLGRIVENIGNQSLDAFFRENIAAPLGIEGDICFLPPAKGEYTIPPPQQTMSNHLPTPVAGRGEYSGFCASSENMAATETCPWRGRTLQGEVHDEHAWLLNGVAGHAGLFGRVRAVAACCEMLVDAWQGRGQHPGIPGEILRKFLAHKNTAGIWALGFDRPTPGHSSSGGLFSGESVGHLGFTGTSFWLDLARERIVILLTNRVHPDRENRKIQTFRPAFHNAVMREMAEK